MMTYIRKTKRKTRSTNFLHIGIIIETDLGSDVLQCIENYVMLVFFFISFTNYKVVMNGEKLTYSPIFDDNTAMDSVDKWMYLLNKVGVSG